MKSNLGITDCSSVAVRQEHSNLMRNLPPTRQMVAATMFCEQWPPFEVEVAIYIHTSNPVVFALSTERHYQ
jgi:hypothetical protein